MGDSKSLMWLFYCEHFLTDYEEWIINFETEHEKGNKPGSATSHVHQAGSAACSQPRMQGKACRASLGGESKAYT